MSDGGFLVKFDGKETFRCYSISFEYDSFTYKRNDEEPKELPREGIGRIEIILE